MFRHENGTFRDVFVITPEFYQENIYWCTVIDKKPQDNSDSFPVHRRIPCGAQWETFSSQ